MSGDTMSIESTIKRIDDVIKGLTSIKDKKILEWASSEDWSVGIGIGLLNNYKEMLNKRTEIITKDVTIDVTHEFLKSEIESVMESLYGNEGIDLEEMNILVEKVLNDDRIWNEFHFNLMDIVGEHFIINRLEATKVPRMYDDFSIDKRYTYDVYEIKEDGEELFINRYLNSSLIETSYLLLGQDSSSDYDLTESDDFADWYYINDNKNNKLYRIQLFQ